ncbi:hypothetical protein JCM10212_000500 [Sporobolomyces blumeae]
MLQDACLVYSPGTGSATRRGLEGFVDFVGRKVNGIKWPFQSHDDVKDISTRLLRHIEAVTIEAKASTLRARDLVDRMNAMATLIKSVPQTQHSLGRATRQTRQLHQYMSNRSEAIYGISSAQLAQRWR